MICTTVRLEHYSRQCTSSVNAATAARDMQSDTETRSDATADCRGRCATQLVGQLGHNTMSPRANTVVRGAQSLLYAISRRVLGETVAKIVFTSNFHNGYFPTSYLVLEPQLTEFNVPHFS